MRQSLTLCVALCGAMAAATPVALAHEAAHVHGQMQLDVVVDGAALVVRMQTPLDNLVGFEHRPRTAKQRQAADAALATLNDVPAWLMPPAAAGCTAGPPQVDASALMPAPPGADEGKAEKHADLDAEVVFQCSTPAALTAVEVGLFKAFPRLKQVNVQIAGPHGQHKRTLRKPATTLKLGR